MESGKGRTNQRLQRGRTSFCGAKVTGFGQIDNSQSQASQSVYIFRESSGEENNKENDENLEEKGIKRLYCLLG